MRGGLAGWWLTGARHLRPVASLRSIMHLFLLHHRAKQDSYLLGEDLLQLASAERDVGSQSIIHQFIVDCSARSN